MKWVRTVSIVAAGDGHYMRAMDGSANGMWWVVERRTTKDASFFSADDPALDPITAATLDARLAAGHALEIGRRTYSHDILLWDDHHIGLHLGVHHDDGELI